jgi:hypothetical protein
MSLPEACLTITPEQVIKETPWDAIFLVLEMNHVELIEYGVIFPDLVDTPKSFS